MIRSLRLYAHAAVLGLLALASAGYAQTASPHNQKPDIKTDLIVGGVDAKEPQYAWGRGARRTRAWLEDVLEISGRRRAPAGIRLVGILKPTRLNGQLPVAWRFWESRPSVTPTKSSSRSDCNERTRSKTSIRLKLTVYAFSTICVREERDLTATIGPTLCRRCENRL